jgi:hypothetical protein
MKSLSGADYMQAISANFRLWNLHFLILYLGNLKVKICKTITLYDERTSQMENVLEQDAEENIWT